jgi:hypothetical protein
LEGRETHSDRKVSVLGSSSFDNLESLCTGGVILIEKLDGAPKSTSTTSVGGDSVTMFSHPSNSLAPNSGTTDLSQKGSNNSQLLSRKNELGPLESSRGLVVSLRTDSAQKDFSSTTKFDSDNDELPLPEDILARIIPNSKKPTDSLFPSTRAAINKTQIIESASEMKEIRVDFTSSWEEIDMCSRGGLELTMDDILQCVDIV